MSTVPGTRLRSEATRSVCRSMVSFKVSTQARRVALRVGRHRIAGQLPESLLQGLDLGRGGIELVGVGDGVGQLDREVGVRAEQVERLAARVGSGNNWARR